MIWPLKRTPSCEEVPAWHGFVYYDWHRQETITAPVPLHVVLSALHHLAVGMREVHMTKNMVLHDAYKQGIATGLLHALDRQRVDRPYMGVLIRPGSFWIGWHWSSLNRRLCINLIPCVTVWVVWPGGVKP